MGQIYTETLNCELMKEYFGSDADMLRDIEEGNVKSVDIIVDFEKRTAEYRVNNSYNDGIYIGDDYEGVVEWLLSRNIPGLEI